jgi:hypothetical protein
MLPNGYSSDTVRYPSLLTHQTIVCHSKGFEYALVLMAHRCDPNVVFIVEQPGDLTLFYPSGASEKPVQYRPDFLVLWKDRPPTVTGEPESVQKRWLGKC